MVCKWQVEIDEYANRVLAKHWPNVRRWPDVRTWPQPDTERVDVICGGFPCQDISYAGAGAGLDGARSGLFFEAVRVVQQLQPRIVVLENVAALLTRGLDRVLGTLAEIGYDAEWHCIPAAAVGAPHIRDRVFVIAYSRCELLRTRRNYKKRKSTKRNTSASINQRLREDVADANEPVTSKGREQRGWQFMRAGSDQTADSRRGLESNWLAEPAICFLADGISPGLVRYAGRVATGIPNRINKLRGLGNAVVPQVAEWIGRRIVEQTSRRRN